eukprot:353335-Chlamydomonas_euryale.AAC.1
MHSSYTHWSTRCYAPAHQGGRGQAASAASVRARGHGGHPQPRGAGVLRTGVECGACGWVEPGCEATAGMPSHMVRVCYGPVRGVAGCHVRCEPHVGCTDAVALTHAVTLSLSLMH